MTDVKRFKSRHDAGKLLAQHLNTYAQRKDVLVLALPRGGVPVGYSIATTLQLPLDILSVRKLGMPGHEEFALGAIASGGARFIQDDVKRQYAISDRVVDALVKVQLAELERREKLYRGSVSFPELKERIVILVDDGLATGSTMKVAAMAVRQYLPAKVIVAVPVGAEESINKLREDVDEIICLAMPKPFYAVGNWYENFEQTSDEEVIHLLSDAAQKLKEHEKTVKPEKENHYFH
jgi:putative phosphoribosyl transferase